MITLIIIMIILFTILLIYTSYIKRNYEVHKFRFYLIDLCSNYAVKKIANSEDWNYDKFLNKYSHKKMLYSFKPLKLENWFTKEEIDELLN